MSPQKENHKKKHKPYKFWVNFLRNTQLATMFTRAAVFTAVVASATAFQPTLRAGVASKVLPLSAAHVYRR
jgi:hypothetical protein